MAKYPSLKEVLDHLGEDCILVGSATVKALADCKDIDFVVNQQGYFKLAKFDYWLVKEIGTWYQYIPETEGKCVDFFFGICDIHDSEKHQGRLTFEEASRLDLRLVEIDNTFVLSI